MTIRYVKILDGNKVAVLLMSPEQAHTASKYHGQEDRWGSVTRHVEVWKAMNREYCEELIAESDAWRAANAKC